MSSPRFRFSTSYFKQPTKHAITVNSPPSPACTLFECLSWIPVCSSPPCLAFLSFSSLNAPSTDPIPCCPLPTPQLLWLVCPVVGSIRTLLQRVVRHRTLRSSTRARVPDTSLPTGMTMDDFCNTNLTSLTNISRTMQLEIRVFSPAIKSTPGVGDLQRRALPAFGDHDEVPGVVLLDPRYCTSPGRVTVAVGIG